MQFARYAIYYLPEEGALSTFGASWLGWDVASGGPVPQPDVPGIEQATDAPRKYGFHGTLKPPFRLAEGRSARELTAAVGDLADATASAVAGGLALDALGRFLALKPTGDQAEISRVAAACVTALDSFRAPATPSELERRRAAGLSPEQDALLVRWGYPYVLNQFRFHLTLTGRLPRGEIDRWIATITTHLPPLEPRFHLREIALVGERSDGRFELIQRFELTGVQMAGTVSGS